MTSMPIHRKRIAPSDRELWHAGLRVLIAPDKFKGTLTSAQAARAIACGVGRAWPGVKTTRLALTDGGEGFVDLMVKQTSGKLRWLQTIDAVGRPCRAKWGVLGNGTTAVIGLTEASGIAQIPVKLRNPEITQNLGTGAVLSATIKAGFSEILVGLGGSATTEGGISLAAAIGYRFLDTTGNEINLSGSGLAKLARIVPPLQLPRARFVVATDVNNPLFGRHGAAFQFGPQKGADSAMVRRLDAGLRRLARIVQRDLGQEFALEPGAGAAGGCGYGLMTFFNARRENGFQLVRRLTGVDALIRAHDLIITGEGCFDRTSLHGKAPAQLGELARKLKRPVWALCGRVELPASRTPFDRLAGLGTRQNPLPSPDLLSPVQHAANLEDLAFKVARQSSSLPVGRKFLPE